MLHFIIFYIKYIEILIIDVCVDNADGEYDIDILNNGFLVSLVLLPFHCIIDINFSTIFVVNDRPIVCSKYLLPHDIDCDLAFKFCNAFVH
ncbi:hypothetical protein DERP_004204 [Dermatophagoides pteronyssinus]|uniref:Uncharacterized protein n=1 Tax=Dermatophagoides pteronyssinus TaxID=6956 RepID=A0ABQ8J8L0_DERPT|nr:hypothetical protein DERP_004204 [Dermatophagoides pteronyssinus]